MKRNIDGVKLLGCCTLVVIFSIKCTLAVTVNELEINPKLTLIADEVKEKLEKTKEKPDKPCWGPPTEGKCRILISGFTFDLASYSCKKFEEGGCKRTNNGFLKKEDCETKCVTTNVRENLKEGEDCGQCFHCPYYCVPDSRLYPERNCGKCGKGLKCRPSAIEDPGKCIKERGGTRPAL